MTETLKPCPFCGSPAYIHSGEGRDYDRFIIKCDGDSGERPCHIYPTTQILLPEAEAIAAWNTRAPDDVAQIVAWLRGEFCRWRQHPEDQAYARIFADAIERGDWKDKDDG